MNLDLLHSLVQSLCPRSVCTNTDRRTFHQISPVLSVGSVKSHRKWGKKVHTEPLGKVRGCFMPSKCPHSKSYVGMPHCVQCQVWSNPISRCKRRTMASQSYTSRIVDVFESQVGCISTMRWLCVLLNTSICTKTMTDMAMADCTINYIVTAARFFTHC